MKSEHAAAARLVCHGENWKEGSWKQGNNRLGNADDGEEMIKTYINVSCMQLYVEFADLEVLLIIILHPPVKQGQQICLNLCFGIQGSKQWGPGPAHSLQCPELLTDLLTAVSKTFLFSVPHLIAVTKNLGYVPGKLLM